VQAAPVELLKPSASSVRYKGEKHVWLGENTFDNRGVHVGDTGCRSDPNIDDDSIRWHIFWYSHYRSLKSR